MSHLRRCALFAAFCLAGCTSCPKYVSYQAYTVNIEGIQAKTGKVEASVATIKLDPKYRDATERLQNLDLLQARTCQQLRSMKEGTERERLESLYIKTLIEMQQLTIESSSTAVTKPPGTNSADTAGIPTGAKVALRFSGTTDVLRGVATARAGTRNNPGEHYHPGCYRAEGPGNWCTYRTDLVVTAKPPRYLGGTPRPKCVGQGCPWTNWGPYVFTADRLQASIFIENWGGAVDAILEVDEYERLDASACGNEDVVELRPGDSHVFTSLKECVPLATIEWTDRASGKSGFVAFGKPIAPDAPIAMDGELTDVSNAVKAIYSWR